jgi:hypothetical protein
VTSRKDGTGVGDCPFCQFAQVLNVHMCPISCMTTTVTPILPIITTPTHHPYTLPLHTTPTHHPYTPPLHPTPTPLQLVLLKKGVRYTILPTLPSSTGKTPKLPTLAHKGQFIMDVMDIAEYIEKSYPHTSLTRQVGWVSKWPLNTFYLSFYLSFYTPPGAKSGQPCLYDWSFCFPFMVFIWSTASHVTHTY